MELRYLKSFVAVAEMLHFGRAAERLKLAQPAVSQHIQKLEVSLDARLLDRNRHGVALTAAGQVFLREARSILAQVEHARNELDRVKAGGNGTLRLGYVPGPARGTVTCALALMRARNPGVRVELFEANTREFLRAVQTGDYDAVLSPELDPPFPRVLEHAEIAKQRVLVAMGVWHPAAKLRVVPLRDLRNADWVAYAESVSPGYRRWVNEVCAAAGFRPRIAQRVTSGNDMQVALAALPGVAIVPEGYREFFTDHVVFRPLTPAPEAMGLWLWWRRRDAAPALAALRGILREAATKSCQRRPRR